MKKIISIVLLLIFSSCCFASAADAPQTEPEAVVNVNHDDGKPDSLTSSATTGNISNGSKGYTRQHICVYDLESLEIPDGYILDTAVLSIYCLTNYELNPTVVGIYELNSNGFDYANEKLTPDNIPARGKMVSSFNMPARVNGETYNAYMDFDLTGYLNELMLAGEKYMAVSAIQTARCQKGGMSVCTKYGDYPPKLTLTFRKPQVIAESYRAELDEADAPALTVGEITYFVDMYNETNENKTARLIVAEVCNDYCVSVDISEPVVLEKGMPATVSFTKTASDANNKIRVFAVSEDDKGVLYPIVSEKYEFDSDGWTKFTESDVTALSANGSAMDVSVNYDTNLITLSDNADDALSAVVLVNDEDGKSFYADMIFQNENNFNTSFKLPPDIAEGAYTLMMTKNNDSPAQYFEFMYIGETKRNLIVSDFDLILSESDPAAQLEKLNKWVLDNSEALDIDSTVYNSLKDKENLIELISDISADSFTGIKSGFTEALKNAKDTQTKNEAVSAIKKSTSEEITDILKVNEEIFGIELTEVYYDNADYVNELLKEKDDLSLDNFSESFNEIMAIPYLNAASRSDIDSVIKEQDKYLKIYDLIHEHDDDLVVKILKKLESKDFKDIDEIKDAIDDVIDAEDDDKKSSSGGGGGRKSSSGGSVTIDTALLPNVPEQVTVKTPEADNKAEFFDDIENYEWAAESINALCRKNIINGRADRLFAPGENITRAEFVKIIAGAFNLESESDEKFTDVSDDAWYAPYVSKAYFAGIVKGDGNGLFNPDGLITREDAATMIYRGTNLEATENELPFSDADGISQYAREAMTALYENNIINGKGNNCICPGDFLTRAECAKIVYGILNLK